jgi:hypothetical protein
VIPRISHYAHLRASDLLLPLVSARRARVISLNLAVCVQSSATRGMRKSPLWEMFTSAAALSNYTHGE